MSKQVDSFSDSFNTEIIKEIDQFDLPIKQKHYVRILAHCLTIARSISDNDNYSNDDNALKEWCNNESKKFDDEKFSDLLYLQLSSIVKKLNIYAQKMDKNIHDLDIDDLVLLAEQR